MSYKYCVIAPYSPTFISASDLSSIGKAIAAKDGSMFWKPVNIKDASELRRLRPPKVPTLMLQFHGFKQNPFPQFRGPRLTTKSVHKAIQVSKLEAAGVRVPKTTRLETKTRVDPAEFGEYLIIKPTEKGASLGRGVTMIRTSEFESYRDEHATQYEKIGRSPPLVQQHIPTGGMPEHFRVQTFLSRVVSCRRSIQDALTPVNAPMQNLVLAEKVASNSGKLKRELYEDKEIEDFALRVDAVFDSVSKGIDILRSSEDRKLYALEVNMGNVWHSSSNLGVRNRKFIGVENMIKQYDLFEICAEAIIETSRQKLGLV